VQQNVAHRPYGERVGAAQTTAGFALPAIPEEEELMAAYFVWHNRIHNAEKMQEYIPKALETLAPYHPEVLVLDENSQVIEGNTHWPRTIVIKFESRDAAMAWYNSPAYQEVLPLRLAATEGFGVLVDGFVPPGP
jgi:uncharacterized protein (DUF1330 family)